MSRAYDVEPILLGDNYNYLLRCNQTGAIALFDTADAKGIIRYLDQAKLKPSHLFLTHHHYDHINGVDELKERYRLHVVRPKNEARIATYDSEMDDGESFSFGALTIFGKLTKAHTRKSMLYRVDKLLFTGDCFFKAGCGRLFEGRGADLMEAMDYITGLDPETRLFFGHEYSLSNLDFAQHIEPENRLIQQEIDRVKALLKDGKFSTPSKLSSELEINPFLRIDEPSVLMKVDPEASLSRVDCMTRLRSLKDKY